MRRLTIVGALLVVLGLAAALPAAALAPVSVFVDLTAYGSTEGIVMDREGNIYATTLLGGEILKISPDAEVTSFLSMPGFVPGENGLIGLAIDADENLYAMVGTWFGSLPNSAVGVYKITRNGGRVVQLASATNDGMVFPNSAVFDHKRNLYVSDSSLGAIFRIAPDGEVSSFVPPHPLLQSRPSSQAPFSVGSNGLAITPDGDELIVAVTFGGEFTGDLNQGILAKVPINRDGTAGQVTTFLSLTSPDGLLMGADGTLYVAQPFGNSIAAVSKTGELSLLAAGAPLAQPASLWIRGKAMYATNLAFPPFGPASISKIDLLPRHP
jgi:sugar lactone lactonase YvrE